MFAAVGLFVVLLIAMLIIAYVRFRDPPEPAVTPPAEARALPAQVAPLASNAGRRSSHTDDEIDLTERSSRSAHG